MKKFKSTLFLCAGALLASCTAPGGDLPARVEVDIDASTPASLLLGLTKARNYTVRTEVRYKGELQRKTEIFYDDYSYHYISDQFEIGYILGETGVFPISATNGYFLPGEVFHDEEGNPEKELWVDKNFLSFASFTPSSFEGSQDNLLALKDKSGRLALLEMAGIDRSQYSSLREVYATVDEGRLLIDGQWKNGANDYQLSWVVDNIQSTRDYAIEEFLEDGGQALDPHEDLVKMRSLFQSDNFTHIYEDENGNPIAYERFNPDYYFLTSGQAGMEQGLVPTGMVGIDHKTNPDTGKALDGCYSVTPSCAQDGAVITSVSVMEIFPYNSSTSSVPEAFHYPKDLLLWESLEWVEEQLETAHDGYDIHFSTRNIAIAYDFAVNFGALGVFEQLGLTPAGLEIEGKNLDTSGKEEVMFSLVANTGQIMEFHFLDFEMTYVPAMDAYIEKLI